MTEQNSTCQLFSSIKQFCSSISTFLVGLLLSTLIVGLVLTTVTSLWLIPVNNSTTTNIPIYQQTSIINTSTMITTNVNTNFPAATITITSNQCTSTWHGVTSIAHCDNCSITYGYLTLSYRYTAIATQTRISFAIRRAAGYFAIDNVSARNIAAPNTELIGNGGFETGNFSYWSYCIPTGASAGGSIQSTSSSIVYNSYTFTALSGSYYYLGGALTYPEYLSQTFSTNIGDIYNISFSYAIADSHLLNSGDFLLST